MKRLLIFTFLLSVVLSCASLKERLAIKECKFSLLSVNPHSFTFSNLKVDFNINIDNPNNVDAVLDKFVYKFYANNTQVFSGTTGNKVEVEAKKSAQFATTITLEYSTIGQAMAEAMRLGSAAYRIDARAYVNTILGEISYPVSIELN